MQTEQGTDSAALTQRIKEEAFQLGFQAVGVAPGSALQLRQDALTRWIQNGYAGQLGYMEAFLERQRRFLADMPNLRSILVLAVPYSAGKGKPPKGVFPRESVPKGRIARYAWGRDYHRAIQKRLKRLETFIREKVTVTAGDCHSFQEPIRILRSIDTSPVQERVLAEAAGLGFFGKNSCLIQPKGGSYFFLATLLTNLELVPDNPIRWDCGSCTLCLTACPTGALEKPYQLNANRCISYLTIELREAIDPELRPLLEDWVFGCDICQEVCPYNQRSASTPSGEGQPPALRAEGPGGGDGAIPWPELEPEAGAGEKLSLQEVLGIRTEEAFLSRFAGTPLMRAKREGLLRNAAVVAGNLKDPHLIPALSEALQKDPSPLVRQHAAWALEQLNAAAR